MSPISFRRVGALLATAVFALGLTACAAPRSRYQADYPQGTYVAPERGVEYGRVARIYDMGGQRSGQTTGAGAVIGGVVGGLLGNQIGKGHGRAAATGIGIVGGAVAGNAIEANNNRDYARSFRIVIQLDRGGQRDYDVPSPGDLRVGDRVRLANGQISRY